MRTINSTGEGYFHSCRFPFASQCVLELYRSHQSPQTRVQIYVELKTFAKKDTCIDNRLNTTYFLNLLYMYYMTVNSRYTYNNK